MRQKAATTAPPRLGLGARATSSPPPSCTRSSARRSRTGSRRSGDALANRPRSCSTSTGPGPARSVWPSSTSSTAFGRRCSTRSATSRSRSNQVASRHSRRASPTPVGTMCSPSRARPARDGVVLAQRGARRPAGPSGPSSRRFAAGSRGRPGSGRRPRGGRDRPVHARPRRAPGERGRSSWSTGRRPRSAS